MGKRELSNPYRQAPESIDRSDLPVDPTEFCVECWSHIANPTERWFQFVRHTLYHNKGNGRLKP